VVRRVFAEGPEEAFARLEKPFFVVPAEDVIHGVFHAQLASLESDAHGSLELHAAGLSFGDTQSRVMLAQTCGDDLDIRGVNFTSPDAVVAVLVGTQSTATTLLAHGHVPPIAAGVYPLCVCRAGLPVETPAELDLSARVDFGFPWTYVDAKPVASCERMPLRNMSADNAANGCDSKCRSYCVGSECYCELFDEAEENALCLPVSKCRAACDAEPSCAGFEAPQDGLCYLYGCGGPGVLLADPPIPHNGSAFVLADVVEPGHAWYPRVYGATCTHPRDYSQMAGFVAVTARARVGATFVLEANQPGSIEIVAKSDATLARDFGWSADRIAVMDKSGVCGLSAPTTHVAAGLGVPQPVPGEEVDHVPKPWTSLAPLYGYGMPINESDTKWVYRDDYYCPGSNMDPIKHPELYEHQCFAKCLRDEECVGDGCFCDGALKGYDDPDTRALCLSEALCLEICAGLPDCVSVDMHTMVNRCFLNEGTVCNGITHEDILSQSPYYRLYWKQNDPNDDGAIESGVGPTFNKYGRRLAAIAQDLGYSWPAMLRFAPITARAPGSYRVCLCDSEIGPCNAPTDFRVEVGELQVSGVACMLEHPAFRKDGCANQYHGGLRCGVPTPEFPTAVAGPELPSFADEDAVMALWALCTGAVPRDIETVSLCSALRHFVGAFRLDAPLEEEFRKK
jgi:hypothetical protein